MRLTVTLTIECAPDENQTFEDVAADVESRLTSSWLPHEGRVLDVSVTANGQ